MQGIRREWLCADRCDIFCGGEGRGDVRCKVIGEGITRMGAVWVRRDGFNLVIVWVGVVLASVATATSARGRAWSSETAFLTPMSRDNDFSDRDLSTGVPVRDGRTTVAVADEVSEIVFAPILLELVAVKSK